MLIIDNAYALKIPVTAGVNKIFFTDNYPFAPALINRIIFPLYNYADQFLTLRTTDGRTIIDDVPLTHFYSYYNAIDINERIDWRNSFIRTLTTDLSVVLFTVIYDSRHITTPPTPTTTRTYQCAETFTSAPSQTNPYRIPLSSFIDPNHSLGPVISLALRNQISDDSQPYNGELSLFNRLFITTRSGRSLSLFVSDLGRYIYNNNYSRHITGHIPQPLILNNIDIDFRNSYIDCYNEKIKFELTVSYNKQNLPL